MQNSAKKQKINLEEYSELIKTVARVEYSRLTTSRHLLEFSELINIGTIAVYVILTQQPESYHNAAYMSTAIKWSIRNELRKRYKWYSNRQSSKENEFQELSCDVMRETVYEAILSIDELESAENPTQIEDKNLTPEETAELIELKKAVILSMRCLPDKEKAVLEAKFFKNKKVKEIALEMGVSSSRISKLVQSALDKIKGKLVNEGVL